MAYRRKTTRRKAPARRRSYRRRSSYRRRAPARRRRVTKKKRMPISKFTLAQLDPFSEKVAGVKIPDVNTQPSSTVVVEDEFSISTGGTYGSSAIMLRPTLVSTSVSSTPISQTAWSWSAGFGGGSNSSKATTVQANNTVVRVCAHGVRLTSALAPTSVTGFVHIAIVTETDFSNTTWSTPQTIADMQTSQWYKRIPLAVLTQKPYKVVNKILDPNAFRYFDPRSDLAAQATDMTLHTSGWANILIAVTGVAINTTAISCESILHYETLPSAGSAQTVTPAASASSAAVEQATNVANSTPAVHEEGMFQNVLAGAAEALGEYGNNVYSATLEGARNAGYNAVMGLGGAAYHWLQGGGRANYRMIQN